MEEIRTPGFILIHRSILEAFYYKEPDHVHLWVHVLMRANWKDKAILFKGRRFPIKRGQFVTSRKQLAKETGIQESKVERILKTFESEQQIEQQSLHVFRLITILNYDEYQNVNSKMNSERTASEQRVNTTKEENKKNKDKEEEKKKTVRTAKAKSGPPPITFNFETELWENVPESKSNRWKEAYPACDIQMELVRMADWLIENPTKRKKNYGAFISRWLSRQQDKGGTRGSTQLNEKDTWADRYVKKQEE